MQATKKNTNSSRSRSYVKWCQAHNFRLSPTDKVIPLDGNSQDSRKLYQIGATTKLKTHKQLIKSGSEFYDALEAFYTALRETEKSLNSDPESPYKISIAIPEHLIQSLRVLGKKIHEAPRTSDNRYRTYKAKYRNPKTGKTRTHIIPTEEILPNQTPIVLETLPSLLKILGKYSAADWTQVN